MKHDKYDIINMRIEKIHLYCTYVDCFARILNEFIIDDSNIKPTDIPNLSELLAKLACQLKINSSKLMSDWEFSNL